MVSPARTRDPRHGTTFIRRWAAYHAILVAVGVLVLTPLAVRIIATGTLRGHWPLALADILFSMVAVWMVRARLRPRMLRCPRCAGATQRGRCDYCRLLLLPWD